MPGGAAGLAILLVPTLLAVLFARQPWRWVRHHESYGGDYGGAKRGTKMTPERTQELGGAVLAAEGAAQQEGREDSSDDYDA